MRMDCRVKHDIEVRKKAAELFASGMGFVQSQILFLFQSQL